MTTKTTSKSGSKNAGTSKVKLGKGQLPKTDAVNNKIKDLEAFQSYDLFDTQPMEYSQLLSELKLTGTGAEDAYQALMAKEQRVLDTINRVVDDRQRVSSAQKTFFDLSLHEVVIRTVATVRGIMDDLLIARKATDVIAAFVHQERIVYVGLVLILMTVLFMLLD